MLLPFRHWDYCKNDKPLRKEKTSSKLRNRKCTWEMYSCCIWVCQSIFAMPMRNCIYNPNCPRKVDSWWDCSGFIQIDIGVFSIGSAVLLWIFTEEVYHLEEVTIVVLVAITLKLACKCGWGFTEPCITCYILHFGTMEWVCDWICWGRFAWKGHPRMIINEEQTDHSHSFAICLSFNWFLNGSLTRNYMSILRVLCRWLL